MNKKQIMYGMGIMFLVVTIVSSLVFVNKQDAATSKLQGKILSVAGGELTVQDKENIIYTFNVDDINAEIGDDVLIEYTGLLDKNKSMQDNAVIHYTNMAASTDENGIPSHWLDNGIFSDFYIYKNICNIYIMKLHKSIINLKIIFYRYIIVEIKGYCLTDKIIYIGSYIMKVKKKTFE